MFRPRPNNVRFSGQNNRVTLHCERLEDRTAPAVVTNLNDAGAGSLRQAIIDCDNNPSQEPQTIGFTVTGNIRVLSSLPPLSKSIYVDGPGPASLSLEGNTGIRMFNVTGPNCTIAGLKIFGCDIRPAPSNTGTVGAGGAIAVYNGVTVIENCDLIQNLASNGGAVYSEAELVVASSTFINNLASGWGGAIRAVAGNLSIENKTRIGGNTATFGGGISFGSPGTMNISTATIDHNFATGAGGGLNISNGTTNIVDSTIGGGNNAALGGGGLYIQSTVNATKTTLANNTAGGVGGGGAYVTTYGQVRGQGFTIVNNAVSGPGAGRDPLPARGGGILVEAGGSVELINSIVAQNLAAIGPDISGTIISDGHNLVAQSAGGSGYVSTDLLDMDAHVGPLADNGGPTFTCLPAAISPAIDAGADGGTPGPNDQREDGFARVVGPHIDIGAVELQVSEGYPGHILGGGPMSPLRSGGFALTESARSPGAIGSVGRLTASQLEIPIFVLSSPDRQPAMDWFEATDFYRIARVNKAASLLGSDIDEVHGAWVAI